MADKWASVSSGMTEGEVIEAMGSEPAGLAHPGPDQTAMTWGIDAFASCTALFREGRVVGKQCQDNTQARAAARAQAAQMYLQMQQQRQPSYQMPAYQAPRPVQTNCTTRWAGGQAYSDCTSRPTGIDPSIYNH
jgi:hypothetical protein